VAGIGLLVIVAIGGWYFGRSKFYVKPAMALTNVASQAAALVEKSIAVLPFESFSDDKESAYFADGVQDDILTDLSKIADLKVISRRSVAQYRDTKKTIREIGQALGVAHVLEGSVRKAAGKIHVTAQLIDARTETQTWGEKYDRELPDVFAIQSEISQAIVAQLKVALSPAEKAAIEQKPTQDQEAYDLFLRARALVYQFGTFVKPGQENNMKAITLLESAIARDPKFVLAYCLLSESQLDLYGLEYWNRERLPKAREAIDAALRISPGSGEAHLALAQYYYQALRDPERAEKELSIASASLPGQAEVFRLAADIAAQRGQWKKALRDCEKATELDPRDPWTAISLVVAYTEVRKYSDAERVIDRMIASLPQNAISQFWRQKSSIALAKGDTKAAMTALDGSPNRNAGLAGLNSEVAHVFFLDRQYGKAVEILQSLEETARAHNVLPKEGMPSFGRGLRLEQLGQIARAQGESEKARNLFASARPSFEEWLAKNPEELSEYEGLARGYIAEIDVARGRKEEGIREGRHAVELWPQSRDARVAPHVATRLAIVYAWAGERDAALQLLASLVKLPAGPSAGDLKLNPVWDDLRSDPRFNALVAEAAQPVKIH
jgi:TolB-like protein